MRVEGVVLSPSPPTSPHKLTLNRVGLIIEPERSSKGCLVMMIGRTGAAGLFPALGQTLWSEFAQAADQSDPRFAQPPVGLA